MVEAAFLLDAVALASADIKVKFRLLANAIYCVASAREKPNVFFEPMQLAMVRLQIKGEKQIRMMHAAGLFEGTKVI